MSRIKGRREKSLRQAYNVSGKGMDSKEVFSIRNERISLIREANDEKLGSLALDGVITGEACFLFLNEIQATGEKHLFWESNIV